MNPDGLFPCWKDCRFPREAGGCPYLWVRGEKCSYYGPNFREGEDDDSDEGEGG